MTRLCAFLITLLLCLSACAPEPPMNRLTQITFSRDSGSILPELQLHEEYTLTRQTAAFSRSGKITATQANAGAWDLPADPAVLEALFTQIETLACAGFKRVEPADPPDGGGTQTYTLTYASGAPCTLTFNPGVTYTGSESLTQPVQHFLGALTLPAEAAAPYRLAP